MHFNSIKVRLKQATRMSPVCSQSNFNSIKVRLKHAEATNTTLNEKFQFHKGTIKT